MKVTMKHDYIEYYVCDAKMIAFWHVHALGFNVVACSGKQTGVNDRTSYLLEKNDIRFIITSSVDNKEIDHFIHRTKNGIKAIGIRVNNIEACEKHLLKEEAIILNQYEKTDANGTVAIIEVKIFDDNMISFADYSNYNGDFLPKFEVYTSNWGTATFDSKIQRVDHIAYALRRNEIKIWEDYLNRIMMASTIFEFKPESGLDMHLKVSESFEGVVNNVIVEAITLNEKSQINSFIKNNHNNGIQHIAFESLAIFDTVSTLLNHGVEFMKYPDEYYKMLTKTHKKVDVAKLQEVGILCEEEEDKILLQTFTEPVCDNQTFFYEIIHRENDYTGFGLNNIMALFEAVEKTN